jgi:hypothetical protein
VRVAYSRPAQPHSRPSTAAGDALDPAAKKAAMVVYAETHPDPTIMTNFLTMAETTVCKATLPSESGSEALLISTSPEHREMYLCTGGSNTGAGLPAAH